MKYLKYTQVDSGSGIPVNIETSIRGPKDPDVQGLKFLFALESEFPTSFPIYYGEVESYPELISGVVSEVEYQSLIETWKTELRKRMSLHFTCIKAREYVSEDLNFKNINYAKNLVEGVNLSFFLNPDVHVIPVEINLGVWKALSREYSTNLGQSILEDFIKLSEKEMLANSLIDTADSVEELKTLSHKLMLGAY